ncbi:hypothetical protein FACS189413_03130 [Bacteroidia bacterium]|nr:hypothetical protein FACS189413_03130 [Bacteroidia bacterium]
MRKRFTIAIPAFKARFLNECIDSILNQTYIDFELVIVNDASPENVEAIVQTYDDIRIRYYKNDVNIGAENVVDNWNKCLEYARCEYFVLMGDDDKLAPNYLEEFVKLIEQYPNLGVYHCRAKIIDENSEFVFLSESRPEYESVFSLIWYRMMGRLQYISDFVYHTETLKNNGGYYKLPLAWASDDISAYITAYKAGIAHTNKPIFLYRHSGITISSTGNIDLKMTAIIEEEKWISDFLITNQPQCEEDEMLRSMIMKKIKKHFVGRRKGLYIGFFVKSPLKYTIWFLQNKIKYQLSLITILDAMKGCFVRSK